MARDKGANARGAAGEGSISIIGPGMRVVGDVISGGTVRVEGQIHGTLRAEKTVIVGKEGEVLGDVSAEAAVIGGRVRGSLTAERLQLQATCDIEGEIRTYPHHLLLEEGAQFNGQVKMFDGEAPPPRAALPPGEPAE